MSYKGFTDAQARAHKKYIEGKASIQLWGTPAWRNGLKASAAAAGESVNGYVKTAIEQRQARDAATPSTNGGEVKEE